MQRLIFFLDHRIITLFVLFNAKNQQNSDNLDYTIFALNPQFYFKTMIPLLFQMYSRFNSLVNSHDIEPNDAANNL